MYKPTVLAAVALFALAFAAPAPALAQHKPIFAPKAAKQHKLPLAADATARDKVIWAKLVWRDHCNKPMHQMLADKNPDSLNMFETGYIDGLQEPDIKALIRKFCGVDLSTVVAQN